MTVTVDEIQVADPSDVWGTAGFSVDPDGCCRVGDVRIRLLGARDGAGIVGWSLGGLTVPGPIDGIPTAPSRPGRDTPADHANGVTAIDHVVLLSPDLGRTVTALAALGVEPRRERDTELGGRQMRQIFVRLGGVIVELVGSPEQATEGPSTLWGITYAVRDIEATAAYFGDRTGPVRDAVQPNRRITTLRHRDLGMSVPTAMISARC